MLALMGAMGAAGLSGLRGIPAARVVGRAPISKWGLQLYTVRSALSRDVDATLAGVAAAGYREVESAGYGGKTAAEFRKALDAVGLVCPSAHVDLSAVTTGLARTLEDSATIGHKWLVVPSLPRTMAGADGFRQAGEALAKAADGAKSAGIRIAYHNHDVDFRPVGGTTGMDILLASSAPNVFAELDVYWIVKAGHDPFDFIKRHPHRVKMLHLKDASAAPELAMRDVGAGTIAWPRLLPVAESDGIEHAFVEHDNPGDAMESIRASFDYLSHMKRVTS